jgi:DNA repair exonuclease SbcCD ATPase subunit
MIRRILSPVLMAPADDEATKTALARGDILPDDDKSKSPLADAGKGGKEEEEQKGDKLSDGEEETEEEKAERLKAEEEEEKKKRIRIPKARLDEVTAKARQREEALLAQIEKLQQSLGQRETQTEVGKMQKQLDDLQDKYEDLLSEGKKDEARPIRKQIEAMRDALIDFKTATKSEAARRAAIDEMTFSSALAGYEAKYSVMNPEHDDFDSDKVDEMADLMEAFVKNGLARKAALDKAVKYVLGNVPESKRTDEAADVLKQKRAEEARKKAAEADKKQPSSTAKVGTDSDKAGAKPGDPGFDVMKLSQKDFEKLDDETLARLRGDVPA